MSTFPQYLGTCAIDNRPLSVERGFYHVEGRGWYVIFNRIHHGPFDVYEEALHRYTLATASRRSKRIPWRLVRYYFKILGQAILGTLAALAFCAALMLL